MARNLEQIISTYFKDGKLMQLSSSSTRGIWMCHVWYASNSDFTEIYFTSNKSRRHSNDISVNPSIAGGIVAIELEGLGQKVRGLTFNGTARLAKTEEEINRAYGEYLKKWSNVNGMFSAKDIIEQNTNMRMYIVEPSTIVLFDEVNYPDNPRQEFFR